MPFIWDYDISELKKTKSGRLLILERTINYGPDKGEKISLSEVKKNWSKLHLDTFKKEAYGTVNMGKIKLTSNFKPYIKETKLRILSIFTSCLKI